ncbi:MAG: sigma-70 region 2 [Alphaproteobacteria bacterium]|nr:sigma-70 region 2 [Alphaproteobacteria bacterium]
MSKTTAALEEQVSIVIANTPAGDEKPTARQRLNVDKAFASILKLIAPRIRHFIRQYGLSAHWDDAEQACAIGVHRAIQAYDPEKAQFTTFVNWQLRGELQGLRFRLMTDQRSSAKKVEATTVSLSSLATSDGEEMSFDGLIEDEDALERVEAAASDYLARQATDALIDRYVEHLRKSAIEQLHKRPQPKRQLARELADPEMRARRPHGIDAEELEKLEQKLVRNREIVERRVFDAATLDELGVDTGVTKERVRQITKRAQKTIADLATNLPEFGVMADYRRPRGFPANEGALDAASCQLARARAMAAMPATKERSLAA